MLLLLLSVLFYNDSVEEAVFLYFFRPFVASKELPIWLSEAYRPACIH